MKVQKRVSNTLFLNRRKIYMNCETCLYYEEDELIGEPICTAYMDEDEFLRLQNNPGKGCPYWRSGDEYDLVKKQN